MAMKQETKSERVAAAVTAKDKVALEAVARARGTTVSELLHVMAIGEVAAEYQRMCDVVAAA